MTVYSKNQQVLYEVVPIRIFLVVMLVFYHAFAIFSGAWDPIEGYPEIPVYGLIDKLSYSCLLEMFVFISGYVFGFQVREKGTESILNAKSIFIKKSRRLIVPSILFSVIYLLIFGNVHQPIASLVYSVLCGKGHMWFLPMLFWCFVLVYCLEKVGMPSMILITILVVMPFASVFPFPFRIGVTMYYFPFFYAGYIIKKLDLHPNYSFRKVFILLIIVFFSCICSKIICRQADFFWEQSCINI